MALKVYQGRTEDGAGGAAPAWTFENGRRIAQVRGIIGEAVEPGSLNVRLGEPFGWDEHVRVVGPVLDVEKRGGSLDMANWKLFPVALYPVMVCTSRGVEQPQPAWIFRFLKDGERYVPNFVELVSPVRLRAALGIEGRQEDVRICPRSIWR